MNDARECGREQKRYAPTDNECACGKELIATDYGNQAGHNCSHCLSPIPQVRTALVVALIEITKDGIVEGAAPKILQQPTWKCRRLRRSHALPPSNSGNPFQSFTSDRCVSRTSFNPLAVTWKYFLARPPRSGVGSPSSEVTNPLSSSRSSAAYTLPTATSRPVRFSSSSHIGTP